MFFWYGNPVWSLLWILGAIWVIYDVFTQNKKLEESHKIMWVILAVLFGWITAIVYYFVYKHKK
jgi:hypothetical protein